MSPDARSALRTIQECVEDERYLLSLHFIERMDERGLFWPAVLSVLEAPDEVRPDGVDEHDRPKWIISGEVFEGLGVELVCALDQDSSGRLTVFITIYWE